MEQIILSTSEQVGHEYFLYVLILILTNTVAKQVFGEDITETKLLVGFFSTTAFIIAAIAGLSFSKLFVCTFFAFGFFDYVGRFLERGLLWLYDIVAKAVKRLWEKIKNWFTFRLYNK